MGDEYLHGHHASVLRSHSWRTAENSAAYLLGELAAGMRVLDVGCGPGTITIDLARAVAPGEVIGVDGAPEVLEVADQNSRNAGAEGNLSFRAADVYALPFADDSFDVVHAHQVLQHLSDPVAALREMRRVCSPGGIVAARDADYGAMTWWPRNAGLERWQQVYRDTAYAGGYFPDAGRMLESWTAQAGFSQVIATNTIWRYDTADEVSWWSQLWAERSVSSGFAAQAVAAGVATEKELAEIADAWHEWGRSPDAWFVVPHGEIIARA